jgi:hypothetical protein
VHEARWRSADLLIVSDGEFGCTPATLAQPGRGARALRPARAGRAGRRPRDPGPARNLRRHPLGARLAAHADAAEGGDGRGFSPVHSKSLTALYFPKALLGLLPQRHARTPTSCASAWPSHWQQIARRSTTSSCRGHLRPAATTTTTLLDNAFTNYRQVLKQGDAVAGDGRLSQQRQQRQGQAPNENYARELLQLFSLGTCELNADGSLKGGTCSGRPTTTRLVRNYAYALTGWTYPPGGTTAYGCWPDRRELPATTAATWCR